VKSSHRHSRYWRTFKDLPVQGVPLTLRVRLGRWRCRNTDCERKIFTERIPAVAVAHRQRTERLESIVQLVGHSMGGLPAERLMKRLGMAVSDDTILRRLKSTTRVPSKELRAVGIDDWAWKKGQNYGTILVDLESRTVADLLPERSAKQVEDWLKQHSQVEIVSRDRFGLYAQAAQQGAPQARQVADRFHLLLNLGEAVEHELSRQRRLLFYVTPSASAPEMNTGVSNRSIASRPNAERAAQYKDVLTERKAINKALFDRVHRLRQSGMKASQIVRETRLSRKRVDKWLRLAELPERNKIGAENGLTGLLPRLPGAEMEDGMSPRQNSFGRTSHTWIYRLLFWIGAIPFPLAKSRAGCGGQTGSIGGKKQQPDRLCRASRVLACGCGAFDEASPVLVNEPGTQSRCIKAIVPAFRADA